MVKNSRKTPDSNPKLKLQKLVLSKQQNSFDKITIEISDISENINTTSKKSKKFPIKKGQWTPQEDKLLEHWVRVNGPKDWEDCGRFIQGRKGKQCREHWNNCLNPDLLKGNWTPEEDFLIMFFYQKCKGSWKKIIPLFNGRIENSIKNRFYSQLRKYATKNMCAKDRKRLSPKIKLNELKNYINEAIIEAKTDFLYKSKMSKEEFTTNFKAGKIEYSNIKNINKFIINPQISINNLQIQNVLINIPNETENFGMNISGIKTELELFDINEDDMNILSIEKKMEAKLDDVTPKIKNFEESLSNMKKVFDDMKVLSDYYSKDWKSDYFADEEGKLPKNLKRGVLGQDTLYDLFQRYYDIGKDMKELSDKIKTLK